MFKGLRAFVIPCPFGQYPQQGPQRSLCLPQRAEDWFFEAPTCTSEIYGALLADEDEITGDESRQLANLENAVGRVVMDHGSSWVHTRSLAPVRWHALRALGVKYPVPS